MVCGGLLLQALLFCCTAVTAQDIWATKTNLPMNLSNDGGQACVAVGSFLYHFDGRPSGTAKLMKYTPATDTLFSGTACAPSCVALLLPQIGLGVCSEGLANRTG